VSFDSEIRPVRDIERSEFRNRDTSGSPKHKPNIGKRAFSGASGTGKRIS